MNFLPAALCLTVSLAFPSLLQVHAAPTENNIINSEAEANVELDCFVGGAGVWKITPGDVESTFKKRGFAWLDESTKTRGIIRPRDVMVLTKEGVPGLPQTAQYKQARHKLTLFGAPVYEATLEFSAEKLTGVTISIWNKGDAEQSLAKGIYDEMVKKTAASLDTALKARGRDLGKDNSGAAKISRWRWEAPETLALLEHSSGRDQYRDFAADFIRVRLAPKGVKMDSTVAPSRLGLGNLATKVKKTANGDVYVDSVPMVDQGEKGYCAVASTERVMRYYGIQVDQHELAKAADTSQYGTKPQDFEDALHRLQGRFKIRVRDLITFDQRDYERIVANYNREAKKAGGRQWEPNMYYFEFNPDIMREARCRAGAFEKFRGMIVNATSRGVPLLWALSLGRYPETGHENPQGGGGHMRTIIGYNSKTDEVIFTDSWGAGHELKRMKGRDACAATNGLYLVEPASN